MTHPLAALIAGVPRFRIEDNLTLVPDNENGNWITVNEVLAALEAAPVPDLTDPVTVHANMLRGTIAKPTVDQIIHLYGREAFQPMIDAAVAKALKDACLAVSEHADWPEDEHGRTQLVGLFARVINAILAITPARAPHVNETPKSEHDAGDVLTALPADVAAVVEEAGEVIERLEQRDTSRHGYTGHPLYNRDGRQAADTIRALIALATAQAAQIKGMMREAESWRSDYRALEKAIVGDTGLSAMTVATQARLFRPRAEAAETALAAMTKERDEALYFLDVAVDKSPEPLKALGKHLANLLDEDDWPTAERLLNGAAAALAAERAKVARLVEALVEHNDLLRSAFQIAKREGVKGEIASTNWDAYYNRVAVVLKRHHQTTNDARAAITEVGQ